MLEIAGMVQELKVFLMVFEKLLLADKNFMDRLKNRVRLREVKSEDESDVIIAFVGISSRPGTDIKAAFENIPQSSRPVVLVVLHHTFDSECVIPDSSLSVTRQNVFTVDCLFHEDIGLLRCLCNDMALKAVTDHLKSPEIFKRASFQLAFLPKENTGAKRHRRIACTIILVLIIIGIPALVVAILYGLRRT